MKSQLQEASPRPQAEAVWERYRTDLEAVEAQLTDHLTSDVALVGEVARYVLGSGGKRFRPLLLAAAARMSGCSPVDRPDHPIALLGSVVEYIHTATLLHDDVVDEGDIRRGKDAARTLWGNPGSVLVGDYLYARGLAVSIRLGRLELVQELTCAVEEMSQGEVFQLSVCGDIGLTEDNYLRIVELKTASLMSAACRLGGMLGNVTEAQLKALDIFGRSMGIAFQVADDTLDYEADATVFGKVLGGDLKEGKITLPLLYALERCDKTERTRLSDIVARDDVPSGAELNFVREMMDKYDAIHAALKRAQGFSDEAKKALDAFADGDDKDALLYLADYVVERDC